MPQPKGTRKLSPAGAVIMASVFTLALVFGWIAFFPGERHFSGSSSLLGFQLGSGAAASARTPEATSPFQLAMCASASAKPSHGEGEWQWRRERGQWRAPCNNSVSMTTSAATIERSVGSSCGAHSDECR